MPRRRENIITRVPNSRFYFYDWTIDVDGKPVRFRGSTRETNPKKARKVALQKKEELEAKHSKRPKTSVEMTLGEAAEKAFSETFSKMKSPGTYRAVLNTLKNSQAGRLLDEHIKLSSIDSDVIENYVDFRKVARTQRGGRTMSPTTINFELSILTRVLKLAKQWKIKGRSVALPIVDVSSYRLTSEDQRRVVLTENQIAILASAVAPHAWPILDLILLTGMRPKEAIGLTWEDFDLEESVIRVAGREVFMIDELLTIIKSLVPPKEQMTGPIFRFGDPRIGCDCAACVSKRGQPIKSIRTTLQHARDQMGLSSLTMGDLRDHVGKILTQKYGPSFTRQVLGHKNIQWTKTLYGEHQLGRIAMEDALSKKSE